MKKIDEIDRSGYRPVEEAVIKDEEQESFNKKYWKLLNILTPKEYIVLALSISGLENGQTLADDSGVTRSNISRIKKNIARKLKSI